jgi:hypothetical protein
MTALTGTLLPAVAKLRGQPRSHSKPGNLLTDEKFARFLGELSVGTKTSTALTMLRISPSSLEGRIREDKKAKGQIDDARVVSLRRLWSEDVLEAVLVNIAMGATVKQACTDVEMQGSIASFYSLILRDPTMREAYDEARTIQAEKMAIDDIIEIADETENDETWDGKGNAAAVNRARLKVDSRKWIAGKLNFKRFGDKQQVDLEANIVVDHAARLEEARKRKEVAHNQRNK